MRTPKPAEDNQKTPPPTRRLFLETAALWVVEGEKEADS